jgi:hypothetical protein
MCSSAHATSHGASGSAGVPRNVAARATKPPIKSRSAVIMPRCKANQLGLATMKFSAASIETSAGKSPCSRMHTASSSVPTMKHSALARASRRGGSLTGG